MARPFEIVLPAAGHTVVLGDVPLSLGRAPGNDVVLTDDTISWHHAQVWVEAGHPWLRDLGSRNGTWRNDERVHGAVRLTGGDRIRLGAVVEVVLEGESPLGESLCARHVEDLTSGVRLLVRSDRFLLGSDDDCDLRVEGWPPRAATVVLHANGEIWLGTAEGEDPIAVGEPFEVQGRRLRVVEEASSRAPTVDWVARTYPYALRAIANAATGPQVTVSDPVSGAECLVTGNRGVLLFVLARRLLRDRETGAKPAEEGWCNTKEAVTGVWGRDRKGANHLNVLVHRLRAQLEEHGFDPWFVEKRRGGIRVRCGAVDVR